MIAQPFTITSMAQTDYQITVEDGYVVPAGPLPDNDAYITFVVNMAAQSYMKQYNTATVDEGIAAALAAYNASLPPAPEPTPAEDAE